MSPVILRNAKSFEESLKKLQSQDLTLYQIARALKISPATARRYMNHLKMGPTKRRKNRNNQPDPRIEEIVTMRKRGDTLDQIGKHFGITRERARQILQRECPDFVFPVRVIKNKTCNHCGVTYVPTGPTQQFCNQKCMGSARNVNFNRDTAIEVMRQRNLGRKWSEIAEEIGEGASSTSFRCQIQRYKKFFSSSEQAEYFPLKKEKRFKPNSVNELENNPAIKEDQDSLIINGLHYVFSLIRPKPRAKSEVESDPQGTARRERQP